MDIDTVAKIISKSQIPVEVRYDLITGEKTISINAIIAGQPFSSCLERENGFL